MTTAERRSQQRKIDFLSRASGTWNLVSDEAPSANSGGVLSLFSSNRSTAERRQLISSMKLDSDGGVEILEGTYRVYGKDSELELLPTTDDSKAIAFALTKDQVRFVEGTWTFTGDGEATLKLQRSTEPLRFRRDASDEKCQGADCELANCNNKNCPQHAAAAGANSIILPIESASASGQQDE